MTPSTTRPRGKRHTAEVFADAEATQVIVLWDDDINPRDTTPLWAAVHHQSASGHGRPPDQTAAGEYVVIEVSGRPPARRCARSE
jgi:hypothetical protein